MIIESKTLWKIKTSEALPTHKDMRIAHFANGVLQLRVKSGKRVDVLEWMFDKKRFKDLGDVARYIYSLASEIQPQIQAGQYNNRIRWIIQLIITWILSSRVGVSHE